MGRLRLPPSNRGYTLVELSLALFLGLLVVLALGRLILQNQRSWEWGRDKAVLQQNTTEALEWMARSVRAARSLAVVDTSEFRTYDEIGALVHTYRRHITGGVPRLQEDGSDLVDRVCTRFRVDTHADTTSLSIILELQDDAGDRVAARTRATVRNKSFEF